MKQLGFPSLSTRALGPHAPVSSREKHHFSSSQCFLLTGPELHFVNSHPHSSSQKTRNLPLGKWDSLKGSKWLQRGCLLQEPQDLLYPPGTGATRVWPRAEEAVTEGHNWTLYRNRYDVCPRKYTPVVCKIKCVGILSAENTLLGLVLFVFK